MVLEDKFMHQVHVTVAAIIEHNQKFVLVTDKTKDGLKLNQPAGHVEIGEDIIDAVIREVKEETSLDFTPQYLVGIYYFQANLTTTYIRFCFGGELEDYSATPCPMLADEDVIEAKWYSLAEIQDQVTNHRSKIVLRCVEDYLAGNKFPLETIVNYPAANVFN